MLGLSCQSSFNVIFIYTFIRFLIVVFIFIGTYESAELKLQQCLINSDVNDSLSAKEIQKQGKCQRSPFPKISVQKNSEVNYQMSLTKRSPSDSSQSLQIYLYILISTQTNKSHALQGFA